MNVKGKTKRMGRYEGKTAASRKAIVTLTGGSKETNSSRDYNIGGSKQWELKNIIRLLLV